MKNAITYTICLLVGLLLVVLPVQAQPGGPQQPTATPPSQETVTPQPTVAPPLFQIGALATEDGAAVSFWLDGNTVKMLYVYADGQFFFTEQYVACNAIQATAALGGHVAMVFVLCDNRDVVHVRFDLHDSFAAEFGVPSALYLPLVMR
jgi:hypothetical protein